MKKLFYWRYDNKGKRADYYDTNTGQQVGLVHEKPNGDCVAMYRDNGKLMKLGDSETLYYIEAKKLVEITALLSWNLR
jgi:hypothetical protein